MTREDRATPRLLAEFRATFAPWLFEPEQGACPPGFHMGLGPPTPGMDDTGPDGAERKGVFLPPIPLPRRMWAAGSIETFRPLTVDSVVTRTSSLADIRTKQGASGEMCLVSILHEFADADGVAIAERQDLVFRAASGPVPPAGPSQHIDAEWSIAATPLLLFRFSAFTFNGHRIHYDLAHTEEEGYPDLLVQGALQAVLMLNLAPHKLGHVPRRFDYRCLAPLFAPATFGVAYDQDKLRVIRADGVTTAEGQAHARGTG